MSTWKAPAHDLLAEQARILALVPLELDDDVPTGREYRASSGSDRANLRGLPAIGRGVSGAIAGTSPEQALMAKQSRRRPPSSSE